MQGPNLKCIQAMGRLKAPSQTSFSCSNRWAEVWYGVGFGILVPWVLLGTDSLWWGDTGQGCHMKTEHGWA